MTRRPQGSRLYWRSGRAYADFRDFADVGGRQEALIPRGATRATDDQDRAAQLLAARLEQLKLERRRRLEGTSAAPGLATFAAHHIAAKRAAGKVTQAWLEATATFLTRAADYFGADRALDSIKPSHVRAWRDVVAAQPARKQGDRTISAWTVRAHLFALSNLYRRAQEEEFVPLGHNPVAALMEKPARPKREAKWLEVPLAALLLESARTLPPIGGSKITAQDVERVRELGKAGAHSARALARMFGVSDVTIARILAGRAYVPPIDDAGMALPLVATFLLTGGRMSEVLGLELDDVSMDRRTITFRPNKWRRLKTEGSWRVVPLWPQLAEILQPYLDRRVVEQGGRLLFPSPESVRAGEESMWQDSRKLLDRVARRAGWQKGEIRHRIFRHTYTAARLQTLDNGAPVSLYTVSRELGHGSQDMVERIYSHLGATRHRAAAPEFRLEQHRESLGERLEQLGWSTSVTVPVTAARDQADETKPRAS